MAKRKSSTLDGSAKPLAGSGDGELLAMIRRWESIVAEREKEQLFARILDTRATTALGMLGKLDCYPEMPFAEPECASVYDDLRGLCGLPPSASTIRDRDELPVTADAPGMNAGSLMADSTERPMMLSDGTVVEPDIARFIRGLRALPADVRDALETIILHRAASADRVEG